MSVVLPKPTFALVGALKKHFKNYEVKHHIGFGGYFGLWSIYSATHKTTGAEVALWYLDLKAIEKAWFNKNPGEYKNFLVLIRRDPGVPGRFTNHGLLESLESYSDDKNSICYVTEPIATTLSTMFHVFGHNSLSKAKTIVLVETQDAERKIMEKYRKEQEAERQKAMKANGGQTIQYNNSALNKNQFAVDQYQQPQQTQQQQQKASPMRYVHPWGHLVDFCERDAVAYGVACLLNGLENLRNDNLVLTHITPANIAITPTGEWKFCGVCGLCENGFNFDIANVSNTAPLFRPSLKYISINAMKNKCTDASSDMYGLFATLMTVFGFGSDIPKLTNPNQCRTACSQLTADLIKEAEIIYGASLVKTSNGKPGENIVTPQDAAAFNNGIRKNWQTFIHAQFNIKVCPSLKDLQPIGRDINDLLSEKITPKMFYDKYQAGIPEARLARVLSELDSKRLFGLENSINPVDPNNTAANNQPTSNNGTGSIDDGLVSFLSKYLPHLISSKTLERSTMRRIIWPRITSCLANPALHSLIISPIIDVGRYIELPQEKTTFLLEPLILACTFMSKRRAYPDDPPIDSKFYFGTNYIQNSDVKYGYRNRNPFQTDYQNQSRNSKGKTVTVIPSFDDILKQNVHNKLTDLQIALLENADFFCDGDAGARSHLAVLGLLVSSILSTNGVVVASALKAVSTAAPYIAHEHWMSAVVTRKQKTESELGKNIKDTFSNMGSAITKAFNTDPINQPKEQPKPQPTQPTINNNYLANDYRLNSFPREVVFPLDNLIIPSITLVLSKNPDPIILRNCLVCVKLMLEFMINEQIEPAIPNLIRDCMGNISQHINACLAMMSLISVAINRFSPKITTVFIFPIVLKTLYHPQIKTSKELEAVRSVAANCWKIVLDSTERKIQALPAFAADETEETKDPATLVQKDPNANIINDTNNGMNMNNNNNNNNMNNMGMSNTDGNWNQNQQQNNWGQQQTPVPKSAPSPVPTALPWEAPVEPTVSTQPWDAVEETNTPPVATNNSASVHNSIPPANPWDAPVSNPAPATNPWDAPAPEATHQTTNPWDAPAAAHNTNPWDAPANNQNSANTNPWEAPDTSSSWNSQPVSTGNGWDNSGNNNNWNSAAQNNVSTGNPWDAPATNNAQTASNPWDTADTSSNPTNLMDW